MIFNVFVFALSKRVVTPVSQEIYFYLPRDADPFTNSASIDGCNGNQTYFLPPMKVQCFIEGVRLQLPANSGVVTFRQASRWYRKKYKKTVDELNSNLESFIFTSTNPFSSSDPGQYNAMSPNVVNVTNPTRIDQRQHKDYINRTPKPVRKFIDTDVGEEADPDSLYTLPVKAPKKTYRLKCSSVCTPPTFG